MISRQLKCSAHVRAAQALVLFGLLCFSAATVAAAPRDATAAPAQRQPVLVELFTSEGCSDCPPADDLLARLDQQQFVAGAQAIVLSEHVTYWNHQGWRDPFSSSLMDQRQLQYARQFALDTVYTPQVVVDGAEQLVGSDEAKLAAAVRKEAAKPKGEIRIEDSRVAADGAVSFKLSLGANAKGTVIAAVAQDATVSRVSRGENAGRTLHHVAVVRALKEVNGMTAGGGHSVTVSSADLVAAEKSAAPLRIVVFLVNNSGNVMGAAEQPLRP